MWSLFTFWEIITYVIVYMGHDSPFERYFHIITLHSRVTWRVSMWLSFVKSDYATDATLQHTATHCNTLQHTSAHCNTLPHSTTHTATHCNTLQHTATHCNTVIMQCGFCGVLCVIISPRESDYVMDCVASCAWLCDGFCCTLGVIMWWILLRVVRDYLFKK